MASAGRSHRILVIGCGSIGKRHADNLKRLNAGEILAFDPREDRRVEVRSRFDVETPATLEAAWKREPDVAVVAAPTSAHVALAREAAEHGCHLLIQKPLADRLDGPDPPLHVRDP